MLINEISDTIGNAICLGKNHFISPQANTTKCLMCPPLDDCLGIILTEDVLSDKAMLRPCAFTVYFAPQHHRPQEERQKKEAE